MADDAQAKKEVAEILLNAGAVSLSPDKPFTFASGIRSPIYCDNRLLMGFPKDRRKIVCFFIKQLQKLDFDVIAGTATAGIPWAAWLAAYFEKPMVYVRSKSKDHGKGNRIEGKLQAGQKVVVIEDLISTGSSSADAVQAIKDSGADVVACVAIFTYEMSKASVRFEEVGCDLVTLSDFSALVSAAKSSGSITNDQADTILEWNKDPDNWASKVGKR